MVPGIFALPGDRWPNYQRQWFYCFFGWEPWYLCVFSAYFLHKDVQRIPFMLEAIAPTYLQKDYGTGSLRPSGALLMAISMVINESLVPVLSAYVVIPCNVLIWRSNSIWASAFLRVFALIVALPN